MIQIQRKDLPLKGFITTFECKLNEPEMDKQIKKIIDKYGDRQNHKTNVKAQMTEWKMWNELGFEKLSIIVLDISKQISKVKYNNPINTMLTDLWGVKYKSGEMTTPHAHWPSLWSFVYYINAPKNAPGLFFPDMGEQGGERKIEPGLLIFFEGHIKHEVRPAKFKGYRYVVSGNIEIDRKDLKND
tara:strand:+ start:3719 stop:4276 length:558 start_codon:yes stop_codon:yes gene_type:complete